MMKKNISPLTITGIGLLVAGIIVTVQTSLPDAAKGLFIGIAIGILALPLILKKMQKA